jgi:hypothetical protein
VDLADLAVNGRPGSVSSAGCTGRMRVLRRMHLGTWVGETGPGEGRTAAARGRGASARNRACRKVEERGKMGRRGSLPQRGAPTALARWWKAVEQRRRACVARVCKAKVGAAGGGDRGRWEAAL